MSKILLPLNEFFASRNPSSQIFKFILVGGTGTALHYVVIILAVAVLSVPPGYAAFIGASVGAFANYLLNRRFTFDSRRPHRETLPRFVLMASAGAVLNGIAVGMLSITGMHFLLAQAIATVSILILNFVVSKTWIFR
jgi:putative flippase GtrA